MEVRKEESAKTCINLISEMEKTIQESSMGDRLPLFKFSGNIKSLKKDARFYYEACMNKDCNKKVTAEGDGSYRCEKCCQVFKSFKPVFIFNACVQDGSGQIYVTFSGDVAEQILGISA